ncbi:choice-of-anchor J domain-containing protein, partial [Rubrivirga sp.]|uniref:choice-of-anchor J domain-containing protein n=1 Tax=Rubrivirga sp. TaxID=1885344 RepID=UPI003C746430
FSFESSNSFSDGSSMQVLYSGNWDGTPANIPSALWEPLADVVIVSDSTPFGTWVFSNFASLDCLSGTGHLAFKYEGSGDSSFDGTYEIDNITLTTD